MSHDGRMTEGVDTLLAALARPAKRTIVAADD
jgi:hypothetical protein